ncbi:MAG: hypothetical protein IJT86_03210 [Spirochaetales bacterium]|nr:hypothetical protein [Spirochaetales bacterium]MBQ3728697.1 hypothetical protein [Spirochaetales bacterium]MBQ3831078.1 hypothetical protein [Spirochaetales bacterium]MBQ4500328.1 hypothetical protein [Spirochaetales bacterium]MBQ7729340.1 hypothetical protein [Spirochaetales bacterium]
MNSKLLRVLTLLLQILVITICLTICVYGIVVTEDIQDSYPYIAATVRVSILLLITISYYKTSVSAFNPGNLFMMMAMLYMSITELRILSYFTGLTGWSFLPPRVGVWLQLFSQFMLYFSLAGYALFYQNNEHSSTTRFNALGTVAMLFLALTIPSTQDIAGVWGKKAPLSILVVIASIALITFMIILINEQSKAAIVRLIGLVLMMLGNFAAVVLSSFIYYAAGSVAFFIGGFMVMVVTLRNSVIL